MQTFVNRQTRLIKSRKRSQATEYVLSPVTDVNQLPKLNSTQRNVWLGQSCRLEIEERFLKRELSSIAIAAATIIQLPVAATAQNSITGESKDQKSGGEKMADCPVTPSEVKQDAARMTQMLKSGDPQFFSEFTSLYGEKGTKSCASAQFITELARLDPDDVKLNASTGDFSIDPWRIVCTQVIDDLKHQKAVEAVNQKIAKEVAMSDHQRFMTLFNSQAKPLHVKLTEDTSTHHLEVKLDI